MENETEKKYGKWFREENTKADKRFIFGMDSIKQEVSWPQITDFNPIFDLYENLGVKSIRHWLHFGQFLQDPFTYKEPDLRLNQEVVREAVRHGFQIVGMSHVSFYKSADGSYKTTIWKPIRNTEKGSYYQKWLLDYEQSWYMTVKAFPEITYWEIDNEDNNDDFIKKLEGGLFTLEEKAKVFVDMLYYGSKGIHRANPQAVAVMGGLVTWGGPETFLNYLYDDIFAPDSLSKYPDDYFQVACWHPYPPVKAYNEFSDEDFVKDNDSIYNVIRSREGKDKKVFFTEAGFVLKQFSMDHICENIKHMYALCRDKLPYVESLHFYRPFDDYYEIGQKGIDDKIIFGLFTDPLSHGGNNFNPLLGQPKPAAYAYQEAAGGQGSLDFFCDMLNRKR
jgi:hypothetical protein